MTWFMVEDSLSFHRKVMQAGNAAMGLWVRAGAYCGQQLTDGFVPTEIATALGTNAQIKRLVTSQLWHAVEGGYSFHEWHRDADGTNRNMTADDVKERRRKRAEAGRIGGLRSGNARGERSETEASASQSLQSETEADTSASVRTPSSPLVGTSNEVPRGEAREARSTSKGTRVPDDFYATDEMIAWARQHTPDVGRAETDKFVDYWRGVSGQKGVKRDWQATWRNWMRRAQQDRDDQGARRRTSKPTTDDKIRDFLADTGTEGRSLYALPGGES